MDNSFHSNRCPRAFGFESLLPVQHVASIIRDLLDLQIMQLALGLE